MDRLSHSNFAFSVAYNGLGPEGAKILAEALHVNSSMTFVDLSSNSLGGYYNDYGNFVSELSGIKAIAGALSVSTSLNSLK